MITNMKYVALFIALSTTTIIPIPLPSSLATHAVFYKKSRQLNAFSCGYNTLFNAANLEQTYGFHNPYSNYAAFESICRPYAQQYGYKPRGPLYNTDISNLAKKLLTQNIINLTLKNERIIPLFDTSTHYSYPHGSSKRTIKLIARKAVQDRAHKLIEKVRQHLSQNSDHTQIVHFGCFVKDDGEGHIILATLVQNKSGRGLYIFDNMNEKIKEGSDIKYVIDYLTVTFEISPKHQFKGPQLPTYWPTIPHHNNAHRAYYYYKDNNNRPHSNQHAMRAH